MIHELIGVRLLAERVRTVQCHELMDELVGATLLQERAKGTLCYELCQTSWLK